MPVKKKYEGRCQKTGIVCRKGILLTNARGLAIKNQNFIHAALNCSKLVRMSHQVKKNNGWKH